MAEDIVIFVINLRVNHQNIEERNVEEVEARSRFLSLVLSDLQKPLVSLVQPEITRRGRSRLDL